MKRFLSFAMAAVLLMAGCAKDNDSLNVGDQTVAVTFSAQLPIEVSRTVGDGSQATVLSYAIYSEAGELFANYPYEENIEVRGNVATLTLDLVKGQKYKIAFWAQNAAAPYTFDRAAKTVKVAYDAQEKSNDEIYDAFYALEPVEVKGPFQKTVTLRRPFAQINLGATKDDVKKAKALGVEIDKSQVTFTDVPTVLNLVDGTLGEETTNVDVTFTYNALPAQELDVKGEKYAYIAANYILADTESNVTDVTFSIKQGDKVINENVTVPAVSYKRNYRTNILGRLLTSSIDFNIVIDGTPTGDIDTNLKEEIFKYDETKSAKDNGTALFKAIMAAADNSTIFVPAGTYVLGDGQTSRYTNKAITLVGAGAETILKGEKYGIVIDNAVDPTTPKAFTLKNLTVATDHSWGAGVYVKNNIEVYLEDVTIKTAGSTAILIDNANTYTDGQYYEGINTIVNAKNVTIDSGDAVELLALPCTSTNQTLTTYAHFNYEGGNIGVIKPQGSLNLGTNNLFVNGKVLPVGGVANVVSDAELSSAIAAGCTQISVSAGNYVMPQPDLRGKTLSIVGTKDAVIDASAISENNQFVTSATLAFEGVTVNFGTAFYMGFANCTNLSYKDCYINGLQFLYGPTTFEGCKFNSNGAEHSVWTYGSNDVSFTGCEFTYGDRCVNVYGNTKDVAVDVAFTNCKFATTNAASLGAVEVNSSPFTAGVTVALDGCTAPANGDMVFISSYDSEQGANATITIDGVRCYPNGFYKDASGAYHIVSGKGLLAVFTTLNTAATETVSIVLDKNIDLQGIEWPVMNPQTPFVLDGQDNTISNLVADEVTGKAGFTSTGFICVNSKPLTIKNVVFENATITNTGVGNSHSAVVVASPQDYVTLEKVTVKNSTVSNADRSSILVAYLAGNNSGEDAVATDCVVEGCTINGVGTCGAILGYNNTHSFEAVRCQVINSTMSSSEGSNKAGIIVGSNKSDLVTLTDCTHSGSKAINAGTETNNVVGRAV